jgi:hypothetical protein
VSSACEDGREEDEEEGRLLDGLGDGRGCCNLKEEALDCAVWGSSF